MMASSALDEKEIRRGDIGMATRVAQSVALDIAKEVVGEGTPYYCVIDRLTYPSLETALVHLRMQHGITARANFLLRASMIGGGR